MLLVLLLVKVLTTVQCSRFSNISTGLKSTLLTNYDKEVRPDATTTVHLSMVLTSLNKLDTASQSLAVTVLWYTVWYDDRLSWDPKLYDNITSLTLAKKEVWLPILVIPNEVDDVGLIGREEVPLKAFSSGTMLWIPPTALETSCEIDVSNYPFDIQTCAINVTGWTLDLDEMDLQAPNDPIDISLYTDNGEWDLVKRSAVQAEFDGGFDKRYRTVQFIMMFRRRWPFYGLTLLCPLSLSSLLMAGVFAVPIESGEKIGYSLTVLLSFTVLLTLISDSLPAISTQTSALQIYLSVLLITGSLVTFLTIIILWLYYKEEKKPLSKPAMVLYRIIACCVCYSPKKRINSVNPEDSLENLGKMSSTKATTTRTPMAWSTRDNSDESHDEVVTWQDLAKCLDAICLRFFMTGFIILIGSFLAYMYTVYYNLH